MPIRITGMNSGLDTESIIAELVKAQKTKTNTLKKAQTSLQWKQDAWKDLNSKIYKLFNNTLNTMRFQSSYAKKTTKVSNSSAVSVITGSNAVNGIQKMQIKHLAKEGYLTGAELGKDVTNSTKLSSLNSSAFDSGNGVINVTVGGKSTDIELTGDTTIGDVVSKLKGLGLNASFDEKNHRFFISSSKSGLDNDFSITSSNEGGYDLLSSMGIRASLDEDAASLAEYEEYSGYYVSGDRNATLDNMRSFIDGTIDSRVNYYKTQNEKIKASQDEYQKLKDNILSNPDFDNSKTSAELKQEVKDLEDAINGMPDGDEKSAKFKELADLHMQLGLTESVESYDAELKKLQDQKDINDKYVTTTLNGDGTTTVTATADLIKEVEDSYYNKSAYANKVFTEYKAAGSDASGATRIAGQNAEIILNNATYKSEDNNFEINGLTITLLDEISDTITINTMDDTDGIYDMVKNFLKEYNSLIIELDKLYNAESAKGYKPLTDEEKEEMSESEIEKWEGKIKDSILRRDETVSSVSSTLKMIMLSGVEIDGVKMNLSNFGINTLGFFDAAENEKNAYHIDGDPDDAETSGNGDKLKTAIANDAEGVMEFFSALTQNLYTSLNKLMERTEFSSFNTVYNDKLMKEQYDDYTKKISAQEKRLKALEDKWYMKFSAMETALARLQKNQSAISSLLGG